jgi:hypothetical protein
MNCERIVGHRLPKTDKLQLLGSVFERLWHVNGATLFGKLLRRIDEALVLHQSQGRIARLHRMLERDYSG